MNERDDLPIRQAFDQLTPDDAAKARMRRRLTTVQDAPAPRRRWALPLTAAACAAALLAGILLLQWPKTPSVSPSDPTSEELFELDTAKMTLGQLYPSAVYAGATYSSTGPVETADIGEKLAGVTIAGFMPEYGSLDAELYAVRGISADYFIAARFPDKEPENYYGMWNADYTPASLSQLIDDLNLRENLRFGQIEYNYWGNNRLTTIRYTLPDTAVIWELLLDEDAPLIEDSTMHPYDLSIGIDVDTIGYRNIAIMLHEDGCLSTNILAADRYFPIGKDKIDAFLEYVTAHGEAAIQEYPFDMSAPNASCIPE